MLIPATPIQAAYFAGRDSLMPLGGLDCVGLIEMTGRGVDPITLADALARTADEPFLSARFHDPTTITDEDAARPLPLRVSRPTCGAGDSQDFIATVAATRAQMLAETVDLDAGKIWAARLLIADDDACVLQVAVSLTMLDIVAFGAWLDRVASKYHGVHTVACARSIGEASERVRSAVRPRPAVDPAVRERLDGPLPEPPHLAGSTTPDGTHPTVTTLRRTYTAGDWDRLSGVARSHGRSTAALVLAAYTRALRTASENPDFLVTVTGVDPRGTENLVVDRTTTYAHRSVEHDEFSAAVRETGDDLRLRIGLGVDVTTEIADELRRGSSHYGLSPYVFTYGADRALLSARTVATFGRPEFHSTTPQTIIDARLFRLADDEIDVAFDVRTDAIDIDIARAVFEVFTEGLDDIIVHGIPTRTVPRRVAEYRSAVNTTPRCGIPRLLPDAFLRWTAKQPTAVAVRWDTDPDPTIDIGGVDADDDPVRTHHDGVLTYAELTRASCILAEDVIARTSPGDVVAIRLPKGPSQVVAVLAVHLAGCAYLPIGVDAPPERVRDIVARSGIAMTIGPNEMTIVVDRQMEPVTADDPVHLPASVQERLKSTTPDDLAYIIYTSGSTGAPKGVAIAHGAASNTIDDVCARHGIGAGDRVLALSALDFDLSVWDIYGPLSSGAAIVTIAEHERRDAFRWGAIVRRCAVTIWNTVPELLQMLLVANDSLPTLRMCLCSGDWIDPRLPAEMRRAAPGSVMVAMGGATEASIWSNEFVIATDDDLLPQWSSVPYGLPLSGQSYRVVDEEGRDCLDGITGELWIGGVGVALGYHRDPDRTAERFIIRDGERWYRTGDLGLWRDGLLFFVGRIDTQVKIRGNRVECGEVEHVLTSLPGVERAVVVPIREHSALGAVVVGESDRDCDCGAITSRLRERLPVYMIPAVVRQCDELVLTANGKVDRRWASEFLHIDSGASSDGVAPAASDSRDIRERCRQLWGEVLGVGSVDGSDNFFVCGGDSLAATRVCARLRDDGVVADVHDMFSHPTLDGFAARCRPVCPEGEPDAAETEVVEDDPFPLTPVQLAYAMGSDGLHGTVRAATAFATILRSSAPVTAQRWHDALAELVNERQALRCTRVSDSHQAVSSDATAQVMTLPPDADVDSLRSYLIRGAAREVATDAVTGIALAGDPHHYGVIVDYLSLDARSLMTVVADLANRVSDHPNPKNSNPKNSNSGRVDPTVRAFRAHAEEAMRRTVPRPLDPPPPGPELPLRDLPSTPAVPAPRRAVIDADDARELRAACADRGLTVSAVLLARLGECLGTELGRGALSVVIPVSQRPHSTVEVLGSFTDLALVTCGPEVPDLDVHAALGEAAAGRAPGLTTIAAAPRGSYPVVFTSTLGLESAHRAYSGDVRAVWTVTTTPGVVIDCQVLPCGNGIELRWDVAAGVLLDELVDRMFTQWVTAVRAMTGSVAKPSEGINKQAHPKPAKQTGLDLIGVLADAIRLIDEPTPALAAVVTAWRRTLAEHVTSSSGPNSEVESGDARALADCAAGRRRATSLLTHPRLAPEQLLVDSARNERILERVVQDLQKCHRSDGQPLRVTQLGSGTGVVADALMRECERAGVDVTWHHVETDALLADIGRDRGLTPELIAANKAADAVVAFGSLHRDERLITALRRFTADQVLVVEVTGLGLATLISAVVDPGILSSETTTIRSGLHWVNTLSDCGFHTVETFATGPELTYLRAVSTRTVSNTEATNQLDTPTWVPTEQKSTDDVLDGVVAVWRRHLPGSPDVKSDSDFFDLGGTSMIATSICADLQSRGWRARIVDLFNNPVLSEFVATVAAEESTPPRVDLTTTPQDLTEVQRAYLMGRSPDYPLGGVAAHCYFEFDCTDTDTDVLRSAVQTVVARHAALRTTISGPPDSPSVRVHPHAVHEAVEVVDDVRSATVDEVADLATHGPLRVRISRDHRIVGLGMDNVLLDGISMWRVMGEIGDICRGHQLPPLTRADRRRPRNTPTLDALVSCDVAPAPHLVSRSAITGLTEPPRFARAAADLERNDFDALLAWAANHRVTPAAIICAAYVAELANWSGDANFSLNVTTFDRDPTMPGMDTAVGDFTTLGLLECRVREGADLVELARLVGTGLAEIVDGTAPDPMAVARELVRREGNPDVGMFPVVFTCGLGMSERTARSDDFGFGRLRFAASQTPQVVLDLQVHDDARGLHITADHVVQLLDTDVVRARVEAVANRLRAVAIPREEISPDPVSASREGLRSKVRALWTHHLGVEVPHGGGNFFSLGGDSLKATRCVRDMAADIDERITMRLMLAHPDLDAFVEMVAGLTARPRVEEGSL